MFRPQKLLRRVKEHVLRRDEYVVQKRDSIAYRCCHSESAGDSSQNLVQRGEKTLKKGLHYLHAGHLQKAQSNFDKTLRIFGSIRSEDTAVHPVIWRNLHNAIAITKHSHGDYEGCARSLSSAYDICKVSRIFPPHAHLTAFWHCNGSNRGCKVKCQTVSPISAVC